MPDYQKGQIYTIRYRLDDSLLYVGSTIQPLHKRWGEHKIKHNNTKCKSYTMLIYQKMRETNDINNWYIELYENFPCNSKKELARKEGEIIRLLKTNLNKVVAGRTQKEYREEHEEEIKEYKKEYREINKEKIAKLKKEYREINKEKIKEYKKEYHENNKEKIAKLNKEYRENNKEKIAEKVTCECGCIVRKDNLSNHKKTIKHQNLMENKASL